MEHARLEVVQDGRRYEVPLSRASLTIGRANDNDLALDDRSVSRHHARLVASSQGWKVLDLGSANGTYVDGERLAALETRRLGDGSSIRVGGVYIVLRAAGGAAASAEESAALDEMARLLADTDSAPSRPEAAPLDLAREVWRVEVTDTDGRRDQADLTASPFPLGRGGESRLRIDDPLASREHAELVYGRGAWQVVDLGSANGTTVDGRRIEPRAPHILADGSVIGIGGVRLTLRRLVWLLQVTHRTSRREDTEITGRRLRIGRGRGCDLRINDPEVSDAHADLLFEDGQWRLVDLGSATGTYVDSERLVEQYPRPVGEESAIQIGGATLALRLGPAPEAAQQRERRAGGRSRGALMDAILTDLTEKPPPPRRPHIPAPEEPAAPASAAPPPPAEAPEDTPPAPAPPPSEAAPAPPPEPTTLAVTPATVALAVTPGESVALAVTAANRSAVVDLVNVYLAGVPQEWVTVAPPQIALFPESHGEAVVTIAPPRAPQSRAGEYHIAVAARSDQRRGAHASIPATLVVRPVCECRLELRPRQRRGWRRAVYRLEIANHGNRGESLALRGADDEELLDFAVEPAQPTLAPGESLVVLVEVTAREMHWVGAEQVVPFTLRADLLGRSAPQEVAGRFVRRPVVPYSVLAVVLAVLLTLVAPLILRGGGGG